MQNEKRAAAEPVVRENIASYVYREWRVRAWFSNNLNISPEIDARLLERAAGMAWLEHEDERNQGRFLTTDPTRLATLVYKHLNDDRVAALEVVHIHKHTGHQMGVVYYYEWP